MLRYQSNRYGDAIVDGRNIPPDAAQFRDSLNNLHQHLKGRGQTKAVWINLPLDRADLLPVLLDHGYHIHHHDHVSIRMARWIERGSPSKIPGFHPHLVRVEALVIRETGPEMEVLLVREKYSSDKSYWKLVTGGVETGEFIEDAGVREVWEETGVRVKTLGVVGTVNRLSSKWGANELITCVRYELAPGEDGTRIRVQPDEIAEARWWPLSEAVRMWAGDRGKTPRIELQWLRGIDRQQKSVVLRDYRGGDFLMLYNGI